MSKKLISILLVVSVTLNVIVAVCFLRQKYRQHNYARYLKAERDAKGAKIIVLGDSRAEGGKWREGLQHPDLANCGIGGFTTTLLSKKLDSILKGAHPQIAILQIGINDLRNNQSPDSAASRYVQILLRLQKRNIKPIVTSVIPVRKDYYQDLVPDTAVNARTLLLNDLLSSYCKKKHIDYVNINTVLTTNNRLNRDDTFDGIHLNTSGYQKTYYLLREYFRKHEF